MTIGQNMLSLQHKNLRKIIVMANEQLTYSSAMKELEEIVQKLQRSDCEIDQLCQLTERSVSLLAFCKEKLTKTDAELVKLLDGLD